MSVRAQGTGWQVAEVNDVPPVKPDWPQTWKSIRHHFGITAFGINAVTKDAGQVLIPEHNERDSGQQEIYFVHKGEQLLSGGWADTFADPQLQSGPLQLALFGAKGDLLAMIEPAMPIADRTTISERSGELEQLTTVTEAKLKRLRELAARGVALQSLVVEAELELEGLHRRREVIS